LQVHQDDIRLGKALHQAHARRDDSGDGRGIVEVPVKDRIASDLPDRKRRRLGEDIALEARKLLRRLLTDDTPVDDIDHAPGISLSQQKLQSERKRNDVALTGRR